MVPQIWIMNSSRDFSLVFQAILFLGIDSGCTRFKEYQGLSSYPAVTPQLGRENQNPSVLRLWSSSVGVECYKSEVL
jgi:hypothetical protein